jgi:hypothetical protein
MARMARKDAYGCFVARPGAAAQMQPTRRGSNIVICLGRQSANEIVPLTRGNVVILTTGGGYGTMFEPLLAR